MINFLFLFVLCSLTKTSHVVDGRRIAPKEELERQLKLINNSSIKSIHTKFGYIVDCVDINKQPAFDHPLLKNHKIQRRPNFNKTSVEISPTKPKLDLEQVTCPRGMVPIRRIAKDDLIQAKSLLNNNNFLYEDNNMVTHAAAVYIQRTPSESYHGVSGTTSVYNPRVYKDQTSGSYIYVQSGQNDGGATMILAGWHVNPNLYGDDSTYTFLAWTTDNFKNTGCYNTLCPGFVQKNGKQYLGARFSSASTYGGTMVELSVSLQQDPLTREWLLIIENIVVGSFPADLFPNLDIPDQLGWGGFTTSPKGAPSPPMGSSFFPDGNVVHTCYFRNFTYRDPYNHYYEPQESSLLKFNNALNCYGVEYYDMSFGKAVQFGGPGGDCRNN